MALLCRLQTTPVGLAPWPHVRAYLERHLKRPSVAKSLATELPLYLAEQKRWKS